MIRCRTATLLGACLGLFLGLCGWQASDWTVAAQPRNANKSAAATSQPSAPRRGSHGIVVVVNDEAITAYEIEQRANLMALSGMGPKVKENFNRLAKDHAAMQALQREVINSNPGKSRDELIAIIRDKLSKRAVASARAAILPKLKKDAEKELIEDRVKVQAARKIGIEVTDANVKAMLSQLAAQNKMSIEQFTQHLRGTGVDINTMGEKFRAKKAWHDFVIRRLGMQVNVTQRDVDRALSSAAAESGSDPIELHVQKILFPLPRRADQATQTKRFAEAEALRRKLSGCKNMAAMAKTVSDARFEDLKYIKPGSIGEPKRSLLLRAKDDDVLPPLTTPGGVELYAVCGRKAASGNEQQRNEAKARLQTKELQSLANRHLRNLMQEANIEYK